MNRDANLPAADHRHHGHALMMIVCVPMLVIAVVLVAIGVASPGILVGAAMCAVMMAVMMRGMSHKRT